MPEGMIECDVESALTAFDIGACDSPTNADLVLTSTHRMFSPPCMVSVLQVRESTASLVFTTHPTSAHAVVK